MDFNDITNRLNRTLTSLNARFDNDIRKNTKVELIETDGGIGTRTTFGDSDENTNLNAIMIILHNLANIKDNLIKTLITKGKTEKQAKKIVEDEINSSLHLQVLIDLVNQEKHGYPLTKFIRSNKNPLIKNPAQSLSLGDGREGSVTEINIAQDGHLIIHGDPPKIILTADIYDDNNVLLFNLNALVDTCYSKWELLAKTYDCIQ